MNNVLNRPAWYTKLTIILAGISLLVYALIQASSILIPFLFAVFISILLSPFAGLLEKYHIPRFFSSVLSVIVGITFLAGVMFFFYNQIVNLAQDVSLIEARINELFEQFSGVFVAWFDVDPDTQLQTLEEAIVSFLRDNAEQLTRGVLTAATTLTMFFLIPIYIFLMLLYRDFLHDFFVMALARHNNNNRVESLLFKIRNVVQNYLSGMFLVICILAVLNVLTLMIIGVDHALFFGVFAALLNVIPFLGPIIGSILPILYAVLTMDSLWYPMAILAAFYVIQLFESNLFTPLIVGSRVSLNPLVTLLAIFIGGQIWGLAGMILFIPALAMLKEVFDDVDSLIPYGYLLGRVKTREQTQSEYFQKLTPSSGEQEET